MSLYYYPIFPYLGVPVSLFSPSSHQKLLPCTHLHIFDRNVSPSGSSLFIMYVKPFIKPSKNIFVLRWTRGSSSGTSQVGSPYLSSPAAPSLCPPTQRSDTFLLKSEV